MVGLLVCGAAFGGPGQSASKEWKALCGKNIPLGLDEDRIDQMLGQCRKNGLSSQEADALLRPAYAARDEALPVDSIFIKIEEGLAKHVDAAQVAEAAEARLDCLRKARHLIDGQHPGRGGEGPPHLLTYTCMALESGLPEEVLQEVFKRQGGRRYGRLVHILEAGETLQLAGLDPRNTQQIMNDCIDRNLNRLEILRAVDYVLAEQRKGRDFKAIHADLWVRSD
ncbi:MAG: hypothetical protein DRP64_08415 [Verrucomicrobia bacterium]|nr:MAG: hypothetical protein DRP64_08415 [Verrucomicrobiota bacterium]